MVEDVGISDEREGDGRRCAMSTVVRCNAALHKRMRDEHRRRAVLVLQSSERRPQCAVAVHLHAALAVRASSDPASYELRPLGHMP